MRVRLILCTMAIYNKPDQTVYQMHKGKKNVHNHMDYWILLCTKINMSCSMSSTVNVIAIVKSLQKK